MADVYVIAARVAVSARAARVMLQPCCCDDARAIVCALSVPRAQAAGRPAPRREGRAPRESTHAAVVLRVRPGILAGTFSSVVVRPFRCACGPAGAVAPRDALNASAAVNHHGRQTC
jgi:hypothetical protein